jgi:outer membrane protein TolC
VNTLRTLGCWFWLGWLGAGLPAHANLRLLVIRDEPAPAQQSFAAEVAAALQKISGREVDLLVLPGVALHDGLREKADAVLVTGLGALEAALRREEVRPPMVVASWHEAALRPVVGPRGASVVGLRGYAAQDLRLFRAAVNFPLARVVVDGRLWETRREACEAWRQALADGLGTPLELVPLGADPEDALQRIGFLAEAVYLTPSDQSAPLTWTLFTKRLVARRIPTASLAGARDRAIGVRFGRGEDVIARLAGETAQAIQDRLEDKPSAVRWVEPVGDWNQAALPEGPAPVPATIHIPALAAAPSPPPTPPIPADLPPPPPPAFVAPPSESPAPEPSGPPPPLDLADILDLALRRNPRYLAQRAETRAAQEAGQEALGRLLPQVDGTWAATRLDEDRASAEDAASSRTTLGVRIRQALFHDEDLTEVRAARAEGVRRLHELDAQALDLLAEASGLYHHYLARARLLELARRHLAEVEDSLASARRREGRGEAAAGEVARWEIERDRLRREVLEAQSSREAARVSLNRVMGERAAAEAPVVESLQEDAFPVLAGQLEEWLDHPAAWEALRRYSVAVGLVNAPELKAGAKEEEIARLRRDRSQRAFYLPELQASFTSDQELSADYPGGDAGRDQEDWSVRFSATLPLFDGARNINRHQRQSAELDSRRRELEGTRARIEEHCHRAVLALQAAWPGLRLQTRAAAGARAEADRSLTEYTNGRLGLLNRLDALASVRREEAAAVWAWLRLREAATDWQRSMAWFELTRGREDRLAFVAGLALRLQPAEAP